MHIYIYTYVCRCMEEGAIAAQPSARLAKKFAQVYGDSIVVKEEKREFEVPEMDKPWLKWQFSRWENYSRIIHVYNHYAAQPWRNAHRCHRWWAVIMRRGYSADEKEKRNGEKTDRRGHQSANIYISICMYLHIYIFVCIHVFVGICIYVYMYVYKYIYMYICIYI